MTKYEKICAIITAIIFITTWVLASHFDWCVAMRI